MASPIRLTYTARRGAEGMGIDAKAGVIVGLVPGGSAEQDRLALVGDEVTAVDGISLVGRRLGELLPAQTGASCELTVTRTDEMLMQQLQSIGLPLDATYKLLRFQVRRSVDYGLGVEMQGGLVREVTGPQLRAPTTAWNGRSASDALLKAGDVVLAVDDEPIGPGQELSSVVEVGRLVYTFAVARQLEEAPVLEGADESVLSVDDVARAGSQQTALDDSHLAPADLHASLFEELHTEDERAAPSGRAEHGNAFLVEELQAEVEVARRAVVEMAAEDALQLDRLAQAAVDEDSDEERGPSGACREAGNPSSKQRSDLPSPQPVEGLTSLTDAVAAACEASQAAHRLLAPAETRGRREGPVGVPTLLLAPSSRPAGRGTGATGHRQLPGVVPADSYDPGSGTWCDLPASLRPVHGNPPASLRPGNPDGEVVWSDLPAPDGSANEVASDDANRALRAMIEQVRAAGATSVQPRGR
jgi:hypothetical protein